MNIDQVILNFFANNRMEWLSFIVLAITYSGSYMIIGGLTFLTAVSFFVHKHADRILPLLVSAGGSAVTIFIIKNIFYRARPFAEAVYLESGSSFPSGHAAMAIALYGFLFYVVWQQYDKHYLKNLFLVFLAVLIVLVGISRLYLGVHYLSDVLAGYIIGLIWFLISLAVSKLKF